MPSAPGLCGGRAAAKFAATSSRVLARDGLGREVAGGRAERRSQSFREFLFLLRRLSASSRRSGAPDDGLAILRGMGPLRRGLPGLVVRYLDHRLVAHRGSLQAFVCEKPPGRYQ